MAHQPSGSAAAWALLWLGGLAGTAWVPLLLVDQMPLPHPPVALAKVPKPVREELPLEKPLPLVGMANQKRPPAGHPFSNAYRPLAPSFRPAAPPPFRSASAIAAASTHPVNQGGIETRVLPPLPMLKGSLLLGGSLGLDSLNEKPVVPAARIEQALRAHATDKLDAIPQHWRPTVRELLKSPNSSDLQVLPAEVVRVPARHLREPEDYPMVLQADGTAETPVTPSATSKETLERWAKKQQTMAPGQAKPVLVVLEPVVSE